MCCFFFFFFFPSCCRLSAKMWGVFLGPLVVHVRYALALERNKRQKQGSAYQWDLSSPGNMKENYMNHITWVSQPLSPLSDPDKVPDRKLWLWHVMKQWPGHLLHWWRTKSSYTLEEDESLQRELEGVQFGTVFWILLIYTRDLHYSNCHSKRHQERLLNIQLGFIVAKEDFLQSFSIEKLFDLISSAFS